MLQFKGSQSRGQTAVSYIPTRSFGARQGLFRPQPTNYSVWAVNSRGQIAVSYHLRFFGRDKASFGLNILVVVQSSGQRSQGVKPQPSTIPGLLRRVKVSFGLNIYITFNAGAVSQGIKPRSLMYPVV